MNPAVHDYLEKRKSDLLIEIGLYEKEYSPKQKRSKEYPYSEFNSVGMEVFFKKIPIEVTDEEYAEILKYQKPTVKSEANPMAVILRVVAVLSIIGGIILGIIFGNVETVSGTYYQYKTTHFDVSVALIYWVVGLVYSFFVFGFAEVIQLLEDIKHKS